MDLETKALLLSVGTVQVTEPCQEGRASTAGPGAGGQSVFFQSGPHIARLSVVESSPLHLESRPKGTVAILKDGKEIACGRLVEPLLHCPEQAYITVSERCIYDCKFCAVPKLRGGIKSRQKVLQMVEEAARTGHLRAISLTSGVEVSPQHEAERVAGIVRGLKRFGVPIGVSVSPFPGVNRILKDAGADEVKYNLECVDRVLFSRVCPGISYQEIMDALQEAVGIFGRNRVFTNIIVGLGESDETVRQSIDELAENGIIPVLRAAYPHPLRAGEVQIERPSAERLLGLACCLKDALEKSGLEGGRALTGCYRCTGCDLIPGRDL
ncbi:MAG: radical SAM protein [Methanotrichaceae archaeon]|nr:radical SAM protein [Methanotrichaceae archaeon]